MHFSYCRFPVFCVFTSICRIIVTFQLVFIRKGWGNLNGQNRTWNQTANILFLIVDLLCFVYSRYIQDHCNTWAGVHQERVGRPGGGTEMDKTKENVKSVQPEWEKHKHKEWRDVTLLLVIASVVWVCEEKVQRFSGQNKNITKSQNSNERKKYTHNGSLRSRLLIFVSVVWGWQDKV